MGGPDMAPQTPQQRAPRQHTRFLGPDVAPQTGGTPGNARSIAGNPWRALTARQASDKPGP